MFTLQFLTLLSADRNVSFFLFSDRNSGQSSRCDTCPVHTRVCTEQMQTPGENNSVVPVPALDVTFLVGAAPIRGLPLVQSTFAKGRGPVFVNVGPGNPALDGRRDNSQRGGTCDSWTGWIPQKFSPVTLEATIRGLDFIPWATGETERNEEDDIWL